MRRALLLLAVTGCGRIDFDEIGVLGQPPPCALSIESHKIVASGKAGGPALAASLDQLGLAFVDNKEVKFLRLTASGDVIGTPVDVGPAGENAAISPAIASSGNDFAILRNTGRITATGPVVFSHFDMGGARIGSDVNVSTHGSTLAPAAIAWNGTRYGTVWGAFDITGIESGAWFAPVGADGTRLGQGLEVGNGGDCACNPVLSWAQTQWGITYVNEFDSQAEGGITRVDADGVVVADPVALADELTAVTSIIGSGSSFVTARSLFTNGVHLATVDVNGTITQTAARPAPTTLLRFANLDGQVILAYADPSGIWLWSLDPRGVPYADPILLAETAGSISFSIAVIDHAVVVVWALTGDLWTSHAACG